MPVPLEVERGEMGKFSFQIYLIFMSFYIYHFFIIPEYLTLTCLLCTDVGLVHPTDFSRNRRRPRPEAKPAGATRLAAVAGGLQSERPREY
jgi:hypothetical protein